MNLCITWILRYHDVTTLWFIRTSTLSFTTLLYGLNVVMGKYTTPLSVWVVAGVVIVIVAILVYPLKAIPDFYKHWKNEWHKRNSGILISR